MDTKSGTNTTDGAVDKSLAEALAMLAKLPLTDAERAEAVRRLLAEGKGS